jgi:chromosome partitioning protein
MPVIAVVNRKGGSGKSTLATHLAAHFANAGVLVMLGDVDRQQSTQSWLRSRSLRDLPRSAPIVGWAVDPKRVLRPPPGVQHVVLDTPGGLRGFDLARVVAFADVILMPVCNSIFDRESAADCYAEMMALPRVASGRCKVAAVGMRLDARTRSADVLGAWARGQKLPFIGVLREAQAYVRCVEQGLTVFDLPEAQAQVDAAQWKPIVAWLEPLLRAVHRPVLRGNPSVHRPRPPSLSKTHCECRRRRSRNGVVRCAGAGSGGGTGPAGQGRAGPGCRGRRAGRGPETIRARAASRGHARADAASGAEPHRRAARLADRAALPAPQYLTSDGRRARQRRRAVVARRRSESRPRARGTMPAATPSAASAARARRRGRPGWPCRARTRAPRTAAPSRRSAAAIGGRGDAAREGAGGGAGGRQPRRREAAQRDEERGQDRQRQRGDQGDAGQGAVAEDERRRDAAGAEAMSAAATAQSPASSAAPSAAAVPARWPGHASRRAAANDSAARTSGTASFHQNIGSCAAAARSARG